MYRISFVDIPNFLRTNLIQLRNCLGLIKSCLTCFTRNGETDFQIHAPTPSILVRHLLSCQSILMFGVWRQQWSLEAARWNFAEHNLIWIYTKSYCPFFSGWKVHVIRLAAESDVRRRNPSTHFLCSTPCLRDPLDQERWVTCYQCGSYQSKRNVEPTQVA